MCKPCPGSGSSNSNMKRRCGNRAPPLPEKLLTIASCWENPFSLRVGPGKSTTLQWKATHPRINRHLNWTWLVKKQKRTKGWVSRKQRGRSERSEGAEYYQNTS